jgi:hypothetical protein
MLIFVYGQMIGLVRTYTRVIRVPVVEGEVVLDQRGQDWDLVLSIVVEDLLGKFGLVDIVPVAAQLLVYEALLRGGELALSDVGIAGSESAIELDVVASHRVIGIIQNGVKVLSRTADLASRGHGQVVWVAEGTVVDRVLQTSDSLTTEDIVHRAVLHLKDNHIFNLALQVADRSRGVSPRLVSLGGSSGDCCREGQQTKKGSEIHIESVRLYSRPR